MVKSIPNQLRENLQGVRSKQSKPLQDYMDNLFNRESFQESLTEQEREMRL